MNSRQLKTRQLHLLAGDRALSVKPDQSLCENN